MTWSGSTDCLNGSSGTAYARPRTAGSGSPDSRRGCRRYRATSGSRSSSWAQASAGILVRDQTPLGP